LREDASLFFCNTCSYIHLFRWMSHLSHLNLNQDISFLRWERRNC
jgi:hypothetical protein